MLIGRLFMERYMVFGGDEYYPVGGMNDFIGSFMFMKDAILEMNRKHEVLNNEFVNDWAHIYDLIECAIVMERYL